MSSLNIVEFSDMELAITTDVADVAEGYTVVLDAFKSVFFNTSSL